MKKNIALIILTLIAALAMFYAYVKASEADQSRELAQEQRLKTERHKDEAIVLQQKALDEAVRATKAQALADDLALQLKECKGQ